jgi:putative component of toxin-antitoxin plasmid stabilization module
VKSPVEIVLETVHVGSARRVVTLGLDGKDLAREFLLELSKRNPRGFEFIRSRIRAVAEHDRFENQITFRSVGDGVFEFKRPGLRLYAFYDNLPGLEPQLIIAANGGQKNKAQQRDIKQAKLLRSRYLAERNKPDVKIRLITLPDEN